MLLYQIDVDNQIIGFFFGLFTLLALDLDMLDVSSCKGRRLAVFQGRRRSHITIRPTLARGASLR